MPGLGAAGGVSPKTSRPQPMRGAGEPPPMPRWGGGSDNGGALCPCHRTRGHPGADARQASPMSGSVAAGVGRNGVGARTVMVAVAAVAGAAVLFVLCVLAAPDGAPKVPAASWLDALSPAVGLAALQLWNIVCLCGHLSASTSGAVRRHHGGLLLLAMLAGQTLLPAADAMSPAQDTDHDLAGASASWFQQPQPRDQPPSPPAPREVLENQTQRAVGASLGAMGLLGVGRKERRAASTGRAGAPRKLLQWPPGVSDADQSAKPDQKFLHEEKSLRAGEKKMQERLERSEKKQETLDVDVKKLQESIFADLGDVKTDVFEQNKELTDDIEDVMPTDGAPGPPGREGAHGVDGKQGLQGDTGQQGQRGKRGVAGPPGKIGVLGPQGKQGNPGKQGLEGVAGPLGHAGAQGGVGAGGITTTFSGGSYFCPEAATKTMRLTDCTKKGCRLEVRFEDTWGSVCSSGFTDQSADTLCTALGFVYGGIAIPNYGGGTGKVWLEDVKCAGEEGDVADCPHAPWGETYCQHGADVGLCCDGGRPTGPIGKRQGPSHFPRCRALQKKDMRLADCNREVCRLEVEHDGVWGTVCDNGFTDKSAQTVCNIFGYPKFKFKQMCATNGQFGACRANYKGKGPIWLDDVVCTGYEREIGGCRHKGWGSHRCSHKQDVGICCGGDEGDVDPIYTKPSPVKGGPGSPIMFKFNENLQSTTGGPGLAAPWGGQYTAQGFHFKKGQGLTMDPEGFVSSIGYTFFFKLKLDNVQGEHMLLRSNGWAQNGYLVIDGHLTAFPNNENGTLWCEEKIQPKKWYYYGIQYTQDEQVKLYLNGGLCGHGMVDDPGTFKLNPSQVMILADNGKRQSSGYLAKFIAFGKIISEKKMARISDCKLPRRDGPCIAGDGKERHIIINAALSGIRYSSVYTSGWSYCAHQGGNCRCDGTVRYGANGQYNTKKVSSVVSCNDGIFGDPAIGIRKHCDCKKSTTFGRGFSAGRLNSKQAWTPMESKVGQWMQMDTGSVQSISGVATQGRRDSNEWVTVFSVKVSDDGKKWRWVECGRPYYANKDRNTRLKTFFHEPVHGRYIRVYPLEWNGRLSMRAGVIVCERPSIDGQLNYQFSLSFISGTQGPSLDPAWGEGDFKEVMMGDKPTMVYKFEAGKGLRIDHWCIKEGEKCLPWLMEYTMLINVRLHDVIGYRKILGSAFWGDYGVYVNKYLLLVPTGTRMKCDEVIRTKKFYKFVMSRDKTGMLKLYVNGNLCAEGSPPFKDHFKLNPNDIMIMKDDATENSGGEIANFHIWDKALANEDVQTMCGCSKPEPGQPCKFTVGYLPPTSKTYYSSVRNDDSKGKGFGRGRLGSKLGWVAKYARIGQFMQIDTGMVQSIAGVITQGRRDRDEWVKTFSVQVSSDGTKWHDVNCGQEWDANVDRSSKLRTYFAQPVKGRYIRLYPQEWHGWISMRMAALICEKPCVENRLDYALEGTYASRSDGPALMPAWGEGIFHGLDGYSFRAGAGFEIDASRCFKPMPLKGWSVVLNVKLAVTSGGPKALMTTKFWGQGAGLYVNRFLQLDPSGSNMVCNERKIEANKWYYLAMTRSDQGNITLYVDGAACARGSPPFYGSYDLRPKDIYFFHDDKGLESAGMVKSIRMWNKHMTDIEMAGKMGCLLPVRAVARCSLGHIAFSPTSKNMKFSSIYTGVASGRLNSRSAWAPKRAQEGEWMQIDTGSLQTIAGVVTQGHRNAGQWVTSFIVKVSADGQQWKDVECQRRWPGNKDQRSKVKTYFPEPVVARYVRLYPMAWHGWPSMRAGALICEMPCVDGRLDYDLLEGSFLSITQGPPLVPAWGTGYFAGDYGYRFPAGKGLQLDQDEDGCMNDHIATNATNAPNMAYSILMRARFDTPWGWRNIIRSKGWGDYGLYINSYLQIFPVGANLKCAEKIDANKFYTIGMTRSEDGVVSLYINGFQCAKGSPAYVRQFALNQHNVDFFKDDGGENSAGYVKRIRMWNKELPPLEMAKFSGCRVTETGKRCTRNIVFGAVGKLTLYSSTYNNDRNGIGHGRGRLNSPQAWSPADRVMGTQFMQIDTLEVQSISGIVVQGRRDASQWVTRVTIQVSNDAQEWTAVQCGMVFEASRDRNTKNKIFFRKPVRARYVRIFPVAFKSWPSMRGAVLLCERPCVNKMLDYKFDYSFLSATKGPSLDPAWGEGTFGNQATGYRFGNNQGLMVDESSSGCIINPDNYTVFIDARIDQPTGWRKLFGSDAWGDYGAYVNNQFQLYPRAAGMKCLERIRRDRYYKFMVSRNYDGTVKLYLNGYKCAEALPPFVSGYRPSPSDLQFFRSETGKSSSGYVRRIAIWNKVFTDEEAAAESECRLTTLASSCEAGSIIQTTDYDRMEYSSTRYNNRKGTGYGKGRLGSTTAWCAGSYEGAWIQIDTGKIQAISGVVTQGQQNGWGWVKSIKVMVSDDGLKFSDVQCGSVMQANTDRFTLVKNFFDVPVRGRFIRVFPEEYHHRMCMRVGALVCEESCAHKQLDYEFLGNLDSTTEGPDMFPSWGWGRFTRSGYRFWGGRGLFLDEAHCMSAKGAYTILVDTKFDNVHHKYQRILNSKGWGDSGLYLHRNKFEFFPTGAELTCKALIQSNEFYTLAISRSNKGFVKMYINGYPCATGSPPYLQGFALHPTDVSFFKDDGSENGAGYVKRIRIFGKQLDDDEVADISGCRLQKPAKVKCDETSRVSPAYEFIKYSSVWANDRVGYGHGRGRLNSPQAWSVAWGTGKGEWMQIDLQERLAISGVVTQGRVQQRYRQWVTQFKVMTSEDGKKWDWVECGRVWEGNRDANTKVYNTFEAPIYARFVRFVVEKWSNWPSMRAGVLMCDRPCLKGELVYKFDRSFLSSTRGPSLEAQWGEGSWSHQNGYRFGKGQGLSLKEGACFKETQEWTWIAKTRLDHTHGYRRIMNSDWADFGVYVLNHRYTIYPHSANMKCKNMIVNSGKFYAFGMTRDKKGVVTLFLNGYPCASGKPKIADGFKLSKSITFFRDDGSENSAGYVKEIKLWNKRVDDSTIRAAVGCELPKPAKPCKRNVIYNAPYTRIFYSNTIYGDRNGYRYGSGRLNARYGWLAASNTLGQFMQIDLRKVKTVSGVVTQGRQDWYEWVTAFAVQVSENGADWTDVQCGNWFQGNTNRNSKLKTFFQEPVQARFVKILPKTWHGRVAMRAGVLVCEVPCKDGELDYPLSQELASDTDGPSLEPVWGDGRFVSTNTEQGYRFASGQGFEINPGSCIKSVKDYSLLVDVSFDDTNRWNRVIGSEGWRRNGVFVRAHRYMVAPQDLEIKCRNYIFSRRVYKLGFTRTTGGKVKLYINGYMCAEGDATDTPKGMIMNKEELFFFRDPNNNNGPGVVSRIRAWNKALEDADMLKQCGCKLPAVNTGSCSSSIILNVPYSRMKASASWHNYPMGTAWARGKLNSGGAWIAPSYNAGNWLQMDTGKEQGIVGVVTQGGTLGWWTKSFYVKVSSDGKKWRKVECGRTFEGNTDTRSKVTTSFDKPVKGRYVRIYPESTHGYPTLRAAVLVCESKCVHKNLRYQLRDSLISKSGGPSLSAPWGEGTFTGRNGYHFRKNEGLQLDESNCMKDSKQYSILMKVRLDAVNDWRALLTSEDWGDNGLYVGQLQLRMKPSDLVCSETIRRHYWYKFGMTRNKKGKVTLFINGYPCAAGSPSSSKGFELIKDNMIFLRGQSGQSSSGYIKLLQTWGKALTNGEMADQMGCTMPTQKKECVSTVIKAPKIMRFRASSIYHGSWGGYYANPILNGRDGWWMAHGDKKRWLQMDLGRKEHVKGVVTQGSRHSWRFVRTYRVKVSTDAKKWKWVECGRYFDGNTHHNTKVKNLFDLPVEARYVRIYVDKYTNWPVMRAGVVLCETECKKLTLKYRLTNGNFQSSTGGPNLIANWGEGRFDTTQGYRFHKDKGLFLDSSRCTKKPKTFSMIIEAKLDHTSEWRNLLSSEDWSDNGLYVHKGAYALRPSKLTCAEVIRNYLYYKFGITRAKDGTVSLFLNGFKCATGKPASQEGFELPTKSLIFFRGPSSQSSSGWVKSIKIWGKTLTDSEMLTQNGCSLPPAEEACKATVIKNPDTSYYRASTQWSGQMPSYYVNPQLSATNGWWARRADQNQWLQIDMGKVQSIAGVVTQGSSNHGYWVKTYKVSVSKGGKKFEFVQCGQVFDANTNYGDTKVKNIFDLPVEGRYIRIHPQTWHGHIVMRAGGIVCETRCKSGRMDWSFDGSFESSSGGPSLDAAWGEGKFRAEAKWKPFQGLLKTGYKFDQGKGLKVDESRCVKTPKYYSVLVDVLLDKTDNWRALMTTEEWGGNGMYVNGNYQLRPTNLVCGDEPIRPGRYYKFGLTRTDKGIVTLSLNGYSCAEGKPSSVEGFKLDPETAVFLRGPHGASSGGYVKRIQVWDKALSEAKMLEAAGCILPAKQKICKRTIEYAPDYSKYRADSVRWNQAIGYYYFGRPDLNARYGWQPYRQPTWGVPWVADNTGAWLQIDLTKSQHVFGIVTRGDGYNGYFVRTYKVRVSSNARAWQDVECGRIFDGNKDHHNKVKAMFRSPVKARYVRIYPESGHYIGMRAGVVLCETQCESGELDYTLTASSLASVTSGASLDPAWGSGSFHKVNGYRFHKDKGLELDQTGCLKNIKQYTMLINVRLDQVDKTRAIFTSKDWNNGNYGVFVEDGILELKPTDLACKEKILRQHWYGIGLERDEKSGNVTLSLNGYPCAMGNPSSADGFELGKSGMTFLRGASSQSASGYVNQIRMWNKPLGIKTLQEKTRCVPAPQAKLGCTRTIIYAPDVSKYRTSSNAYNRALGDYWFGRPDLNSHYGWAPATWRHGTLTGKPEWVQIDVGRVAKVSGVVIRGNRYWHYFVKTYQVMVSDDARKWTNVECDRIFQGSKNYHSKVSTYFDKPVKARYVRIYPESSNNYIGMRAGLLLCEEMCADGVLDYRLTSQTLSSFTRGASLDPKWGDGRFDGNNGYRFSRNQGFDISQGTCITDKKKWTAFIDFEFDQVDKKRAVLTNAGWNAGYDGLYVKDSTLTLLSSGVKSLECSEKLYTNHYYQVGITRADGNVALYINGYQCAQGKVKSNDGYMMPTADDVWVVHGPDSMSASGHVKSIKLYKKTFSASEMKTMAGCQLPNMGEKCSRSVEYAPSWHAYRSSSNVYNLGMGHYHYTRPDINSYYGWKPGYQTWQQPWSGRNKKGSYNSQWLQMDLGKKKYIAGVTTGGDRLWGYYVRTYIVKVSDDASTWTSVECGRIFQGNKNYWDLVTTLFDYPVQARYIRLYPETGHLIGLKFSVQLCEAKCDNKNLDYDLTSSISSLTSGPSLDAAWGKDRNPFRHVNYRRYSGEKRRSGLAYRFHRGQGFKIYQNDCLKTTAEYTLKIKARFDQTDKWRALFTSEAWASGVNGLYIHDDRLQLRPTKLKCADYRIAPNRDYDIVMTRKERTITLYINGYACAEGKPSDSDGFKLAENGMRLFHGKDKESTAGWAYNVQLMAKALSAKQVMKDAGCVLPTASSNTCKKTIVRSFPNRAYKAFSIHGGHRMGQYYGKPRLNSASAWCAWYANRDSWLEMDLKKKETVYGVVTQGRRDANQWIKAYTVQISTDGTTWKQVECGRLFDGNKNHNDKVTAMFTTPVEARYVRILPQEWHSYVCMRAGLVLCETNCKNQHLNYEMQSYQSSTGGPMLETPWGEAEIGSPVEKGVDHWSHDLGYQHNLASSDCEKACKRTPGCSGFVLNRHSGSGCWLKSKLSKYRRGDNRWRDSYFLVNTLYYTMRAPVGFIFRQNQGIQLDQSRCTDSQAEYTVLFTVRMDHTSSYRRLMSSEGWGDKGLFVKDGKYTFYPSVGGMRCEDYKIKRNYLYQYGVTRAKDGTVKMYINGAKCAEGKPSSLKGFELNKNDLTFFHDERHRFASPGVCRSIKIWGKTLKEKDVASEAGCILANTTGAQCSGSEYHLFKANKNDVDFSSVRDRNDYGEGWGRGFNAFQKRDWIPARAVYGEWMQVDLGKRRSVAGLMMNGAWNAHWMTKAYKVMVSDDLDEWIEVECGRIFEGKTNSGYRHYHSLPTTEWFLQSVMARYVRVYPIEWHGMPGGRMSVMLCSKCENDCERNSLTNLPKEQMLETPSPVKSSQGDYEYLVSNNAKFILIMQHDGNLVLYKTDHYHWIWATHTYVHGSQRYQPFKFVLQEDGNMCVRDKNNRARWCSGTRTDTGNWKGEFTSWPTAIHRLPEDGEIFVNTRVKGGGWKGDFYRWNSEIRTIPSVKDKTVAKTVKTTEINYWDAGFASLGFNDRFVVKWSGKLEIKTSGRYTFRTCSDDGSNLFIGTTKVVDNDGLHGRECREGNIDLKAGEQDIIVNFFENGGGANCQVQWKGPGITHPTSKVIDVPEINYNDHSFSKLGFHDRFVAKWTGKVEVKNEGTYTFQTCSDDGSRLFIGSDQVVDNDGLHGTRCREGSRMLAAGLHDVTIDFFENGGGASCYVKYRGPDVGDGWVWLRPIGQKKVVEVEVKDGKKTKKVKKEVPWKTKLLLQDDGNLVLYRESDRCKEETCDVLWSSGTAGRKDVSGAGHAVLGVPGDVVANVLRKQRDGGREDMKIMDREEAERIKQDAAEIQTERAADAEKEKEINSRGVDWQPTADDEVSVQDKHESEESASGQEIGQDSDISYGADPQSETPDISSAYQMKTRGVRGAHSSLAEMNHDEEKESRRAWDNQLKGGGGSWWKRVGNERGSSVESIIDSIV